MPPTTSSATTSWSSPSTRSSRTRSSSDPGGEPTDRGDVRLGATAVAPSDIRPMFEPTVTNGTVTGADGRYFRSAATPRKLLRLLSFDKLFLLTGRTIRLGSAR